MLRHALFLSAFSRAVIYFDIMLYYAYALLISILSFRHDFLHFFSPHASSSRAIFFFSRLC